MEIYLITNTCPLKTIQQLEETSTWREQCHRAGHFAREPHIYQGAGLQSGYDMYGRFSGQGQHIDQFSGPVYPHEGDEAEPPGAYDHIQRYLQSQPAMEEGHGPRKVLPPVQSNLKRHNMDSLIHVRPRQHNQTRQNRNISSTQSANHRMWVKSRACGTGGSAHTSVHAMMQESWI